MARRNILLHPGFIYMKRANRQHRASTERIKVLLAHGLTLYRAALRGLLQQADMQVVGEAADWLEATERCRLFTPDVLVADISLPPIGVKGLRLVLNRTPCPRILLLAFSPDEQEVKEGIGEGVSGILGNCGSAELLRSIRALYKGESFFSAEVANLMAGEPRLLPPLERPCVSLTAREEQVLRLVARGMSNQQIAEALSLSNKTVRNHLCRVFPKLRVKNRTEAALHALREGLST